MTDPPASLEVYLQAWNERDTGRVGRLVARAVTEDALFVDPANVAEGRDAITSMIIEARTTSLPDADYLLASGVDGHNRRFRYRWEVRSGGALLMPGMDVTTLDGSGLIERIDGFFGDFPAA